MARIAIVGTGFVGSTIAFSLLHRGVARELVLIDIDVARAEGEGMDLSHAVPFLKNAAISASTLKEAKGADLVIIAAGRGSLPGETRMDLLADNAGRIKEICAGIKSWKPRPVVIVVSNPVDVLTEIARRELQWGARVFGSGTSLDTARLRLLLGEFFDFDPVSIHGYILGEHGDSEFPAWSTVTAGGVGIRDWPGYDPAEAERLFQRARTAAYEIVRRKKATYFAVGAAVGAIVEAVLRDQRSILAVSAPLSGQYGIDSLSLSLPCVIGREGVARVLEPRLEDSERAALLGSAGVLKAALARHAASLSRSR